MVVANNSLIGNYACDPMLCDLSNSTVYYEMTPLAFVSTLFTYWRGELEFKVEFVGNALLRQRAVIYIVPPNEAAPLTYTPGINYLTTLVDIVGRTEVIVKVPFFSSQQFNTIGLPFEGTV